MKPLYRSNGETASIWQTRRAYRIAGEIAGAVALKLPCKVTPTDIEPYLWLSDVDTAFIQGDAGNTVNQLLSYGLVSEMAYMGDVFWPLGREISGEALTHVRTDAAAMTSSKKALIHLLAQSILTSDKRRGMSDKQVKAVAAKANK